jgi:predicted component of type VI protein secretion system
MESSKRIGYVALTFAALMMVGCASSPPNAKFTEPLKAEHRVRASDTVEVKVSTAKGVEMLPLEQQRVLEQVQMKLATKQAANPAAEERALKVEVHMTRYEKGNAFARAMLAGLGQIHVDASVRVLEATSDELIASFNIAKTFAWGGIYGAATGIEDVEGAFAEGIAAALTGQEDQSAKDKDKKPKMEKT